MEVLLLPVLLGALVGVSACAISKSCRRRAPLWPSLCSSLVIGVGAVFLAFGWSALTARFWTDNPVFDPAVGAVLLYVFAPFALASLIPSVAIVALYRYRSRSGT